MPDQDPWTTGSYPAGQIEPLLRPFEPARTTVSPAPPGWSQALAEFSKLLFAGTSDARAARFSELMERPDYLFAFAGGFARGYLAGGLRSLADWIADLQADIEMYTGEPLALLDVLGHEVLRGLFEAEPKGLSKDTKLVIEASQLAAPLKLLAILTTKNSLSGLVESVGLVSVDILAAVLTASLEWRQRFLEATGDATRQGILMGELYGELAIDSIRIGFELIVL